MVVILLLRLVLQVFRLLPFFFHVPKAFCSKAFPVSMEVLFLFPAFVGFLLPEITLELAEGLWFGFLSNSSDDLRS